MDLPNNSFYKTTSFEDRRKLLVLMERNGVEIGECTWDERNINDHERYPILRCTYGCVTASSNFNPGREVTYDEFIKGLGLKHIPQGESIIRHYFL